MMASVETILLDLDHTLFDPHTIPKKAMQPCFDELRRANRDIGAISPKQLDDSIVALMGEPPNVVAERYGWPTALRRALVSAADAIDIPRRLVLYPDVSAVLALPQRKIVVTTGLPTLQRKKVEALRLGDWVHAVYVDDVMEQPRRGKRAVFESVLKELSLSAAETLVVGDSLESEIAAGRFLGMHTVHIARQGCQPSCVAEHCMPTLAGLGELVGPAERDTI